MKTKYCKRDEKVNRLLLRKIVDDAEHDSLSELAGSMYSWIREVREEEYDPSEDEDIGDEDSFEMIKEEKLKILETIQEWFRSAAVLKPY